MTSKVVMTGALLAMTLNAVTAVSAVRPARSVTIAFNVALPVAAVAAIPIVAFAGAICEL